MTWDYRIIKVAWHNDTTGYQLHEVYYDDDNKPRGRTQSPIVTGESVKEIQDELKVMISDTSKPVLDDFSCDWPELGEIEGK